MPPWSLPADEVVQRLGTTNKGLSSSEALVRTSRYASSQLAAKKRTNTLALLVGQFSSPIVLMLLAAAVISIFLHDAIDAIIILAIVLASGLLGFWQERGAAGAVEKLLSLVEVKAKVLRDGAPVDVAVREVVPGDVVILSAGATAPGDCLLLESRDLFADEATLTGETFPAEKSVPSCPQIRHSPNARISFFWAPTSSPEAQRRWSWPLARTPNSAKSRNG